MTDRSIDPEETRAVGEESVPQLAEAYERFESLVVQAGADIESGVSEAVGDTFIDYHWLVRNAIAETRANYESLGPALVQIAEDDVLAEAEIAQEMGALAGEVQASWAEQGYEVMQPGDEAESLTPAPSEFDAALSGESGSDQSEGG
jgi:hypothetical protein